VESSSSGGLGGNSALSNGRNSSYGQNIALRPAIKRGAFLRVSWRTRAQTCTRVAHSATFNIPDGDVTALKAALAAVNTNGLSDTINLAAGGTYTLTEIDNSVNGANGLPVIKNEQALILRSMATAPLFSATRGLCA
jgi:hypothetical protein